MGHHADLWFREHAMQRRMLSEWKMFQQEERLGERFLLPSRVSRLAVCSTGNVLIFHSRTRIAKFFVFCFIFVFEYIAHSIWRHFINCYFYVWRLCVLYFRIWINLILNLFFISWHIPTTIY